MGTSISFKKAGRLLALISLQSTIEHRCTCEKTGFRGDLTWSHTNRAVQPQKMARDLKFRI